MSIKKLKIIDIFILFGLSFLFHFIYELIPNTITSIFFPVNESIWEHMKLIFTPMVIIIFTDFIFNKLFKLNMHNIIFSNFYSSIITIIIYLIIYLPINKILGHNMIFTILLLFSSFVFSQIVSYYLVIKEQNIYLKFISITFICICYIIFGLLTYYPLQNYLFFDKTNNNYGIKKS
jgi:hypothetical protein